MRIFFSSFLILWTLNQATAQNATKTHKDSLNTIIQKYYDLNLKVFQADSKIEDVDKIFELFSEDFTYIHPKYGGTYAREDLYNGYVRNQKNGGYKGEETAVKIVNRIIGLNAAVVQRSYVINKNGELKDEKPKMTLFEFKKGKIFRIFEYW